MFYRWSGSGSNRLGGRALICWLVSICWDFVLSLLFCSGFCFVFFWGVFFGVVVLFGLCGRVCACIMRFCAALRVCTAGWVGCLMRCYVVFCCC